MTVRMQIEFTLTRLVKLNFVSRIHLELLQLPAVGNLCFRLQMPHCRPCQNATLSAMCLNNVIHVDIFIALLV